MTCTEHRITTESWTTIVDSDNFGLFEWRCPECGDLYRLMRQGDSQFMYIPAHTYVFRSRDLKGAEENP